MSKFQGANGPLFLLCPVVRREYYRSRNYEGHSLKLTGRIRHRKNRYGRTHQDEYQCSCGRVFWTNYNWSRCPIRVENGSGECAGETR